MKDPTFSNIYQIDLIKCLAILLVVIGHVVSYQSVLPAITSPTTNDYGNSNLIPSSFNENLNLYEISTFIKPFTHWITYSALITQQTVPIFIMIMAFNLSMASYRRNYSDITQYYSKSETLQKVRRYVIPFIAIFCVCILIGIISYVFLLRSFTF
jgi:hypothetical protein